MIRLKIDKIETKSYVNFSKQINEWSNDDSFHE
jgi:hypothetical protein